jgi:hypothetical protein
MKFLLRDYALAVGSYIALVVIGLVATLTISSAVGYLPYSDRPGPGWVGPSFSLGQLGYYASWGVLLLIPATTYGSAVFGYHRLLRFLDAPSLLIRLTGALTSGVISLVLAAAAGWYISMATFPTWIAAGLGGVWGGFVLPHYLGPPGTRRGPWVRWTAISFVLLAGPWTVYRLFFSPGYGQSLQLRVVRVTAGRGVQATGARPVNLEPREVALLDSLFPHATLEPGITGSSSTGAADHEARMVIVVTAPLRAEVRLRVPRGVPVVYVQQGDRWRPYPIDAPTLKDRIRIGPGPKPNEMTFAWPGAATSTFTWNQH